MVLRSNKLLLVVLLLLNISVYSQTDGQKPSKMGNYHGDSTFKNFSDNRFKVAKAQINLLKNGGALLVRLKTNANAINRLKSSGSMDLATQVERETRLTNKIIVRAYTNEFKFCPVYFFYSDVSDSVKHKHLEGIFLDTNLNVMPAIVCTSNFYLIAEQGSIYDSSIGFVSEAQAMNVLEKGTSTKEVAIVVKNRFFLQLHKPFPFYQPGYSLKYYRNAVKKFNKELQEYYNKNAGYITPAEIKEFVY